VISAGEQEDEITGYRPRDETIDLESRDNGRSGPDRAPHVSGFITGSSGRRGVRQTLAEIGTIEPGFFFYAARRPGLSLLRRCSARAIAVFIEPRSNARESDRSLRSPAAFLFIITSYRHYRDCAMRAASASNFSPRYATASFDLCRPSSQERTVLLRSHAPRRIYSGRGVNSGALIKP